MHYNLSSCSASWGVFSTVLLSACDPIYLHTRCSDGECNNHVAHNRHLHAITVFNAMKWLHKQKNWAVLICVAKDNQVHYLQVHYVAGTLICSCSEGLLFKRARAWWSCGRQQRQVCMIFVMSPRNAPNPPLHASASITSVTVLQSMDRAFGQYLLPKRRLVRCLGVATMIWYLDPKISAWCADGRVEPNLLLQLAMLTCSQSHPHVGMMI